jgi:RNA polymerase sigma-70 factor (ECF subfamily)
MVELALIAALMHLPVRQRAAFVLRDVSGWTPVETAAALGVAVAAANSLLQRARETVRRHAPSDPRQWRRPHLTAQDKDLLRRYLAATDPGELIELLAEDVRITMPPDPPVIGREAAIPFLLRPLDLRSFPTSANGRPAALQYFRHPGHPRYEATVVDVLRIVDGKIAESNAFIGAHHVTAFGMPAILDP